MEVILLQDMDNLGYKDDLIDVKPGYANNYLIPNGLAIVATKSAKKELDERVKQRAHKEAKVVSDAEALAEKIAATQITITVNAQDGRIFGSITPANLADALTEKGIEVNRRDIQVDSNSIETVGEYQASIRIYREIFGTINFTVAAAE